MILVFSKFYSLSVSITIKQTFDIGFLMRQFSLRQISLTKNLIIQYFILNVCLEHLCFFSRKEKCSVCFFKRNLILIRPICPLEIISFLAIKMQIQHTIFLIVDQTHILKLMALFKGATNSWPLGSF
ncbi:hypothetical protein BpHYR1_024249 [Brachionus plicatilis]|uniref:Uncharacterized protein n=1 Tax=Brachionus plicatilis TaxID=10195 RepID=A0A3M7RTP1_BRAPC|nr:hypothetical protein BpHYR1_024249 [Brachionus plicatilis]